MRPSSARTPRASIVDINIVAENRGTYQTVHPKEPNETLAILWVISITPFDATTLIKYL